MSASLKGGAITLFVDPDGPRRFTQVSLAPSGRTAVFQFENTLVNLLKIPRHGS